ncbi:hypothetical protein [Catenulispora pinisilvae]|uniref:hypothetical protein n=1 Tax=Catenulispora pinisilvae TaxID=2705253 RepID=UPI001890EEC8|nr:hypothetical protein [Catenulispora pinisilvae]
MRPLLLIDVDGPLNPYAAKPTRRPDGYTTHRLLPATWVEEQRSLLTLLGMPNKRVKPLRVWLNPDHGPALAALPYALVWATTWQYEANEYIGPVLGLPELPVIMWPEPRPEPAGGLCWKTPSIVTWAAGRAFAWIDDDITDADQAWVRTHHDAPALLRRIDPAVGLAAEDFAALAAWVEETD